MFGYMGKILRVNLTDRKINTEMIDESIYRKYIGGVGLGAYFLYRETDENTDPLGPENRLIFTVGPFTMTRIPSSGRHSIVAKSPLTGIWAESDVGGHWGLALRSIGYDGIIVQGASESPVYLYLSKDEVKIKDASTCWNKDTFETNEILKKKHGNDSEIQCIGQAGENLVKIANILTDGSSARAAGRCGLGAVMGSKKLKALVVVKGSKKVDVYAKQELKEEIKIISKYQVKNRGGMYTYGTAEGLINNETSGDLPIKNWKQGTWNGKSKKLSAEVFVDKYLKKRFFCGSCVIGCGKEIMIDSNKYGKIEGAAPEYETLGCLGSNTLVDDLEAVCKANDLCNRYGIDTISAGGIIAFAMECYEHGLITKKDTDGLALEWGSPEALIGLIKKIVKKEGIGDLLSNGVKIAAESIGGLAKEFAIETKGLEFPAHEPRVLNGTALSYATSNRGACHLAAMNSRFYESKLTMPEIGINEPHGSFIVEGKGKFVTGLQNVSGLYDSLKICKFTVWFGVTTTKLLNWYNLITGWNMDMNEFLTAGERIYNLKRLYNVKCGISRKDDTLPCRILNSPRKEGVGANHLPPLNVMLNQYYKARGWDEFGIPSKEKVKELGLNNFA
jgi:aldehyde:ferredoxin oxidoreductase